MNFITASTIFMLSVASVHTLSSNFAYNTETSDNVVTAQTIYKKSNDRYLSNHLKYSYTYDDQGRMIAKEVIKWNPYADKWENAHRLDVTYGISGYTIEYARWDKQAQAYSNIVEKRVYRKSGESLVNITSYRWDKQAKDWTLTDNLPAINSPADQLYACE